MKKLLLPLLSIIFLATCQKEITTEKEQTVQEKTGIVAAKGPDGKIDVCHNAGNNSWQTINISINSWPEHQAHGDVRLDDQDGDCYVLNNKCGVGPMNDFDDLNAAIHPGAAEIWNNGIDDNCNGQIDETSVVICNQEWMNRNLDVSTYTDGTPIPEVKDSAEWANLDTGAWCYFDNNPLNRPLYGKLYNWYAAVGIHDNNPNTPNKVLAPTGWHIPNSAEWFELQNCLGGEEVAGGAMKETCTTHWLSPNIGATNSSGFAGLPGGGRWNYGSFIYIGFLGTWLSSTLISSGDLTEHFSLVHLHNMLDRGGHGKIGGYSVRCVKD